MIRLNLRIQRSFIILWCLGIWLFLAVFPPAYESYYPTPESREIFLLSMQGNAGMIAIFGPLTPPGSIGQIVAWEAGSLSLLLVSIMSILMLVGLHRRSEHQGFSELQLSTGIPRGSPAIAALGASALAALIMGAGSAIVLAASGLYVDQMPLAGALIFGITVGLTMIGSALIAHFVLLLISNPASVTRVGLLTVAASFLARSWADSEGISWLNWVAPLGWKQVIGPYVQDNWRNAGILLAWCLSLTVLVIVAEHYRPYGRGIISFPPSSSKRTRRIRGTLHLAFTLNRMTMATWASAVAILSGFLIALTGSLSTIIVGDGGVGRVFEDIFDTADMKSEFIAYVATLMGILAAIAGVQIVLGQQQAEANRTVDLIRATGVRRWTPMASITIMAATVILASTLGILLGGWMGLLTQNNTTATDVEHLVPAAWSQFAPALLLTSIAIFTIGIFPRLALLSWTPIIAAAILTLFGPILQAPEWLLNLSPFEHGVTATEGDWRAHLVMITVSAVLTLSGIVGAQRREIP